MDFKTIPDISEMQTYYHNSEKDTIISLLIKLHWLSSWAEHFRASNPAYLHVEDTGYADGTADAIETQGSNVRIIAVL